MPVLYFTISQKLHFHSAIVCYTGLLIFFGGLVLGNTTPKKQDFNWWKTVSSMERSQKLFKEPFLDSRILQLNSGTMQFIGSRAASAPESETSNVPILFVHGLGGSIGDFAPLIFSLKDSAKFFAINLPGVGLSSSYKNDYSIENNFRMIYEFTLRIKQPKLNFVCHSLGGHICLGFALEFPGVVNSLVLIDAAGIYDADEFVTKAAKMYAGINIGKVDVQNHPGISIVTGGNQNIINRMFEGHGFMLSAMDSFNANYRARIKNLKIPTLIIWGKNDLLFDLSQGFFLHYNIRASQMRVALESGHSPHLDNPELVSRWIYEFHQALPESGNHDH